MALPGNVYASCLGGTDDDRPVPVAYSADAATLCGGENASDLRSKILIYSSYKLRLTI